jgi:hypothetical protein
MSRVNPGVVRCGVVAPAPRRLWCFAPAVAAAGGVPGGSARRATPGRLRRGVQPDRIVGCPAWSRGGRDRPPVPPKACRALPCRLRRRGHASARIALPAPPPAPGVPHRIAGPPAPVTVATRGRPRAFRGRDQARPPRARSAPRAAPGPPDEDDRRRMPKHARPLSALERSLSSPCVAGPAAARSTATR